MFDIVKNHLTQKPKLVKEAWTLEIRIKESFNIMHGSFILDALQNYVPYKRSVRCLVPKIPCPHPYDLPEVHQQLDHTQKLYSEHQGEDQPAQICEDYKLTWETQKQLQ